MKHTKKKLLILLLQLYGTHYRIMSNQKVYFCFLNRHFYSNEETLISIC